VPAPAPPEPTPIPPTDPCGNWLEDVIAWVPPCDVHEAEHFHPWPGGAVELPDDAGLGTCHDWTVRTSEAEGCATHVVRLGTPLDGATAQRVAAVDPTGAPLVVQFFGADLSLLAPIAGAIAVLFVHAEGPVDLSTLPVLPSARTVVVEAGALTGLASLASQPALEGLGLWGEVTADEAAALASLHLRDLGWSGNHPLVLPRLTGVESLRIEGTFPSLRDRGLDHAPATGAHRLSERRGARSRAARVASRAALARRAPRRRERPPHRGSLAGGARRQRSRHRDVGRAGGARLNHRALRHDCEPVDTARAAHDGAGTRARDRGTARRAALARVYCLQRPTPEGCR
jgi:hypothetical protein